MNGKCARWMFPVAAGVVLTGAWYSLRVVFELQAWLVPMPHEIAAAMWEDRILFGRAAWQTTHAALLGFLCAAGGGLLLALALGSASWARRSLYPYLLMLQMTPVIVIAPLMNLWVGRGLTSIVLVTFIIGFFPIVVNTTLGLVSTDRSLVELFDVYDATWWQRLFLLRLPFATPYYFAGLRIAATLAPIGAIFGEYVTGSVAGGTGGLGMLSYVFASRQEPDKLLGVGITSCLLGLVFLGVIAIVNWLLLRRWHDSVSRTDI